MSGNDHASQARTVPGADRGNPGPSGPSVGSRSKKELWHWVHETLQDMARRVWCCSSTACRPSSFGSARSYAAPQCTKPLALRRRCKATTTSPEPDCRRLLQKAGGTRVPSRALYETADGGAGPVGTVAKQQQHPRRLSGRAGGCCEGTSHHSVETRRHVGGGPPRADRDQDGPTESWTDGGNGPKMDIHFPRYDTRLESRRGNLEAMHASCHRTRCCAAASSCRATHETRGPLLHGRLGVVSPYAFGSAKAGGTATNRRKAFRRRNGQKMVGVGAWGALRRGVSRGSAVLHPRRDHGGLDGVRFANCRKGSQAVLLLLRCRPLRIQVAD